MSISASAVLVELNNSVWEEDETPSIQMRLLSNVQFSMAKLAGKPVAP